MQCYKINKLFYNKYPYCLRLSRNRLFCIFRNKNLNYARRVLDEIQRVFDPIFEFPIPKQRTSKYNRIPEWILNGIQSCKITATDFLDALTVYNHLCKQDTNTYKIRVDSISEIRIYSTEKTWLHDMQSELKNIFFLGSHYHDFHIFYEPDENILDTLLNNSNVIIVENNYPYRYKIRFNRKKIDQNFVTWCKNNRDKIKINQVTLNYIQKGYDVEGLTCSIKDDKMLTLATMIAGHAFARVDKCITKAEIDK